MKKFYAGIFLVVTAAAILIYFAAQPRGHGRYTISQQHGRYTTTFHTDAFRRDGPCVLFLVDGDSTGLCDEYTISESHD